MATKVKKSTTTVNEESRLYAALAWFFIPAIYFLIEKKYRKDEFLMYHSIMSVVVGVVSMVVSGIFSSLYFLWSLIEVAFIAFWIYAIFNAYSGKKVELISSLHEWVEKQVKNFSK